MYRNLVIRNVYRAAPLRFMANLIVSPNPGYSSVLCRDPSTRLMDGQNKMWTGAYLCGRVWTGIFFKFLCITVSST